MNSTQARDFAEVERTERQNLQHLLDERGETAKATS